MAQKVSDDERQRIIQAFESGDSCRKIAKDFGRSANTISLIAKSVGHEFGRANLVHAQVARAAYDSERRASLILTFVESSERLARQMFAKTMVHNFGGKNNTYNEKEIDEPTFRDKQAIANSINSLMRTVKDIEARETGQQGNRGTLDDWFARIDANARDYHDPATGEQTGMVDNPE